MNRAQKSASRLFFLIDYILRILGGLLLAGVTLIILLEVLARSVFGRPLPWPEEIATWFVIVYVFITLFILEYRDNYIKVDFLLQRLSAKTSKVIHAASKLLLLGIAFFFLYGLKLLHPFLILEQIQSAPISLIWFHLPIIMGLFLWVLSLIHSLMKEHM